MTDTELRAQIEAERSAKGSLLAFRERFIPAKDDVPPAPFHASWSEILLRGKEHFAVEAFRESAKTQIVIRANLLHALTYPQEGRSYIVVICATQRTASKKLTEVTREFTSSPEMMSLVKTIRESSGLALEVDYGYGVPPVRIEAYGKGAAVRGLSWGSKRPDLVVIDDPQDEEDARSETVRKKQFEENVLGKHTDVFTITRRGEALRNAKKAADLGDRKSLRKFLREYYRAGGTDEGLKASARASDPLYGLNDDEEARFIRWLPKEERKILRQAMRYSERLKARLGL